MQGRVCELPIVKFVHQVPTNCPLLTASDTPNSLKELAETSVIESISPRPTFRLFSAVRSAQWYYTLTEFGFHEFAHVQYVL